MITGITLMITAAIIARFLKKEKWWFMVHKLVGPTGSVFAILGLVMAINMVSTTTTVHFRVPHAFLGLITIIFALSTPVLGFMQFKVKSRAGQVKSIHRWFGRTTIVLMFVTILSGLSQAGII
jgi:hypothetical protein